MRARIRCEAIQELRSVPSGFLHHIGHLHRCYIDSLVVLWLHSDLTTSRPSNKQSSWSLSQVPYPGTICLRVLAKHLEISPDAVCRVATCCLLVGPPHPSRWDRLRHGSLDRTWIQGSSFSGFDFIVDISSLAWFVRAQGKEIRAHVGGFYDRVFQSRIFELEDCFAFCCYGLVSSYSLFALSSFCFLIIDIFILWSAWSTGLSRFLFY